MSHGEAVALGPTPDAAGHQGDGSDDRDPSAEHAEGEQVGAEDPRVGQVADDDDVLAREVTDALLHRVGVEQSLSRVLMGAVTCVDDVGVDPSGDLVAGPGCAVADDEGVDAHGVDRAHRVTQRLTLGGRRALAGDVDRVGAHPFAGDLETAARAGGVLEEQVDDCAAAQGRDLLDLATLHVLHLGGGVEQRPDQVGVEVADREQVLGH